MNTTITKEQLAKKLDTPAGNEAAVLLAAVRWAKNFDGPMTISEKALYDAVQKMDWKLEETSTETA